MRCYIGATAGVHQTFGKTAYDTATAWVAGTPAAEHVASFGARAIQVTVDVPDWTTAQQLADSLAAAIGAEGTELGPQAH